MCLPLRHNKVANVVYQNIIPKRKNKCKQPMRGFYSNEIWWGEIWWNTKVETLTPLKDNKSDIVFWSKVEDKYLMIDISIGLEIM